MQITTPPSTAESHPTTSAASPDAGRRLQDVINSLTVEFVSILDLDELIERIAQRVKEVIDYKYFNLLLADEERGGLVWKKSIGYKPEEVARQIQLWMEE